MSLNRVLNEVIIVIRSKRLLLHHASGLALGLALYIPLVRGTSKPPARVVPAGFSSTVPLDVFVLECVEVHAGLVSEAWCEF